MPEAGQSREATEAPIAALATAAGPAGVSVVRVSGHGALAVGDRFQHGDADVAAVSKPSVQQQFHGAFHALDQLQVRIARFSFGGRPPRGPFLRGNDQAPDNAAAADFEEPVVLGDRAGADRMRSLHFVDDSQQIVGFPQHSQPGQISQQPPQNPLQTPRADDSRRAPAARGGHIEQCLPAQRFSHRRPCLADRSGIAAEHGAKDAVGCRFPGIGRLVELLAGDDPPDQPRGVGHFQAGGDDPLQQRFFDAAVTVVFDQRFVGAARPRDSIALHRGQQLLKLPVIGHCLG